MRIFTLLMFLLLLVCLVPASGQAFSARVVWVTDGDTVTVLKKDWSLDTIRIYGLDCPEKDQPFGFRAHIYTLVHLTLRQVDIDPVERDRYGRLVARIHQNKKSFNKSIIKSGYAWVYEYYCQAPVCTEYKKLETQARQMGKGLWRAENPIPPWRWRRGKRSDSGWHFWYVNNLFVNRLLQAHILNL